MVLWKSRRRDGLRRSGPPLRRTQRGGLAGGGARRIIAIDPHDYIAFTEDYPDYFGDDYDFEIVYITELVAGLITDGKLVLTN